jgi:predicted amidohydrolase
VKIGLAAVSMDIVTKEARRRDVAAFIDEAAAARCQMVFFPEYVNCQRTKEAADEWDAGQIDGLFARHGERVPDGPMARVVVEKCIERQIWCGFGVNERRPDGKVQNCFVLVDPKGCIAGRHVKTHLPPSEDCLVPGETASLMDSPLGKLGVLTCYELYFPELARLYQVLGADLLLNPTADNNTFVTTIARVRAHDSCRPLLVLGYTWPAKSKDEAPCGAAYIDEKGNVVAQSENRRQLLAVDVPVRPAQNNEQFARRRPHVYRQIVET